MRRLIAMMLLLSVPALLVSGDRAPGSYSIGGFGGLGMPMGPKDFKDTFKQGIGFGGEFKYNINETTSLGLSFSYIPLKLDVDKMTGDTGLMKASGSNAELETSGGDLHIMPISANLIKYFTPPEASAGFYLTLGGAYYMIKFTDMKYTWTNPYTQQEETETLKGDSENDFGLNGGLGIEFKAGETMSIFVEGKYHYVFTKKEEGASSDGDNNMQLLTVFGGIRLGLGN